MAFQMETRFGVCEAGPLGISSIVSRRAMSSTGTSTLSFNCLRRAGVNDSDGTIAEARSESRVSVVQHARESTPAGSGRGRSLDLSSGDLDATKETRNFFQRALGG